MSIFKVSTFLKNGRFINHRPNCPVFGNTSSIISSTAIGKRSFSSSAASGDGTGDFPPSYTKTQKQMIERTNSMSNEGSDPFWAAQQKTMVDRLFCAPLAKSESQIRQDLKTAHRLVAKFGWDDLVWNHISARCTADQTEDCCDLPHNHFLITPGGMHFSEIRSEDFLFESIEETGNIMHSGIYSHRPDVKCIIHTHAMPIMAISVLKCGFKFLIQDSAPFYNRIGYHDWEGLGSCNDEQKRLAENLGPDGSVLVLRNHGAVIVGSSIQEAWVRLYYFHRCCQLQLEAMKAAKSEADLIECPKELLVHAAGQINKHFPHGKYEWRAMSRMVEK